MTRTMSRCQLHADAGDGGPPVEPSLVTSAALSAELRRWQRAIKMKYFYRPNPEPGTRHTASSFMLESFLADLVNHPPIMQHGDYNL